MSRPGLLATGRAVAGNAVVWHLLRRVATLMLLSFLLIIFLLHRGPGALE
jgi:hypothetical protein